VAVADADGVARAAANDGMLDIARAIGGGELTLGDALAAAVALRQAADSLIFDLVDKAREEGASWADIGAALGVTTQAAHQRFGKRRAD
jgi:hypothetical protein